jgi:ATP-dependent protease HslVU (ClpYQ) peptidase subunit
MTTIAYKNGVIAYDSQITSGSTITYDDYEKCHEVKGVKFVLSGYMCDYPKLIAAWFGEPVTGTVEASALVFDGEALCYAAYSEKDGLCKTPIWLERPYAIGSGQDFALVAMDMGATAAEAVHAAKKRDTATGGTVRRLVIRQLDVPQG